MKTEAQILCGMKPLSKTLVPGSGHVIAENTAPPFPPPLPKKRTFDTLTKWSESKQIRHVRGKL